MNLNKQKIIAWNANGLYQHSLELRRFLNDNEIEIALISETHLTNTHFLRFQGYTIYNTNHPDGTGHGGTAIIIKNKIKCIELEQYKTPHIQATSIQVNDEHGPLTVSALYCPPKHIITSAQFNQYFQSLGPRFIAAGDFNAKHEIWGSRLSNAKGKNLLNSINSNNSTFLSTGEPTYWPTDRNKTPDLIDFFVVKNVNITNATVSSILELTSDHTPIQLNLFSNIESDPDNQSLYNNKTNWETFKEFIEQNLELKIAL